MHELNDDRRTYFPTEVQDNYKLNTDNYHCSCLTNKVMLILGAVVDCE